VRELDLLALSIKAALERLTLPLAGTARTLCEARVWSSFGYARAGDFARERLGRTGRWLRDQSSPGRSLKRFPALADALCCAEAGSLQAARMFSARGQVASAWVGLLTLLEDFVDTWDLPEASPSRRADEIYFDVKALSNRICLCSFHHRQGEHGFLAHCLGQAPLGVLWRLGRKEVGARFRNERRLDASRTIRESSCIGVA